MYICLVTLFMYSSLLMSGATNDQPTTAQLQKSRWRVAHCVVVVQSIFMVCWLLIILDRRYLVSEALVSAISSTKLLWINVPSSTYYNFWNILSSILQIKSWILLNCIIVKQNLMKWHKCGYKNLSNNYAAPSAEMSRVVFFIKGCNRCWVCSEDVRDKTSAQILPYSYK